MSNVQSDEALKMVQRVRGAIAEYQTAANWLRDSGWKAIAELVGPLTGYDEFKDLYVDVKASKVEFGSRPTWSGITLVGPVIYIRPMPGPTIRLIGSSEWISSGSSPCFNAPATISLDTKDDTKTWAELKKKILEFIEKGAISYMS